MKFYKSGKPGLMFVVLLMLFTRPFASSASDWILGSSGATSTLHEVAFGNGLFVAAGSKGTIITSRDGMNWSPQTGGGGERLNGVKFVNQRFVILADNGLFLESVDGIHWNPHLPAETGLTDSLYSIVYDGTHYVVAGYAVLASSPDLKVWRMSQEQAPQAYDLTFFDGRYYFGGEVGNIKVSSDADHWLEQLNASCYIARLADYNGVLYAVGCQLFTEHHGAIFALDPLNHHWNAISTIASDYSLLALFNTGSALVTANDKGTVYESVDGRTWETVFAPAQEIEWNSGVTGNGVSVLVGSDGALAYRLEGMSFRLVSKMVKSAEGLELSWNTRTGHIYQAQTSNDLAVWNAFGTPVVGTDANVKIVVEASAEGHSFYRAIELPQAAALTQTWER